MLYFDFIVADARLNGPGATLCNSPNHGVNDAKYHYMTAEECLNQLNNKLMEVYGVNTSIHGLLVAVKLVVISIQTFVFKVGWKSCQESDSKIMLDFMSSVFSETSSSNTFSFQGKNFFFFIVFAAASARKIGSELFFLILL